MWIIKNSDGIPARVVTDELDALKPGQTRVAASAAEAAEAEAIITAAVDKAIRDTARQTRYQAESDPLFFKAHRGEATLDEWKAKVAVIKAAIP